VGLGPSAASSLFGAERVEIPTATVCHDILDFVFEFAALACFRQKLGDKFAISAAVLCYGTAAVPIGPRLMVNWTDSVRPARIVRQIGLQV
jgi:hypothetical protein